MENRLLATGLVLLTEAACGKAHALDGDAGSPPPAEVVRDVDERAKSSSAPGQAQRELQNPIQRGNAGAGLHFAGPRK
jgi:hypothetical protein